MRLPWARIAIDELASQLAVRVRDDVFNVVHERNTTVFLCGAGLHDPDSRRTEIARGLSAPSFRKQYELVFPEQLFEELLRDDLLDLENQLANSVDVVILVLESPGAIAELGAFSNHNQLRQKLLCIQNRKYKKSKSFINLGPIKHLRRKKAGHTLFVDWDAVSDQIPNIRKWITKIAGTTKKRVTPANVIHSHHFILPCTFLLEPVHQSTLERMIQYAANSDEKTARTATAAAISHLLRGREIVRVPNVGQRNRSTNSNSHYGPMHVYRLSQTGLSWFQNNRSSYRGHRGVNAAVFDEMRLAVLQWQRRNEHVHL